MNNPLPARDAPLSERDEQTMELAERYAIACAGDGYHSIEARAIDQDLRSHLAASPEDGAIDALRKLVEACDDDVIDCNDVDRFNAALDRSRSHLASSTEGQAPSAAPADMIALLRDPNFRMSGGSQFALEIIAALGVSETSHAAQREGNADVGKSHD